MNNATNTLGDPCCAACAQGKPCDSEKPKTACCEACAQGKPCTGGCAQAQQAPQTVGAADGRGNWCPPGMRAVRTPAAVPNRFICVTDPTQTLGAWHPDLLQLPRPADQAAYDQFVWERASRTLSGAASDTAPSAKELDAAEAKRVQRNRILAGTAGAVCGIAAAWVGVRLYTKQPIVPAAVKAKAQMATEKVKKVFRR